MACRSCGSQFRTDAKFCVRCGASIASAQPSHTSPVAESIGWMTRLAQLFFGQPDIVQQPFAPPQDIVGNAPMPVTTNSTRETLPYRLNDKFLTRAEASFFRVLQLALPEGVLLCPKVNLQDLFWAPPHDYTARNRIDRKHVDFVLADSTTLRPLCGIELDDRSHQRPDRQERDRFVEAVFAAAGLPLVRVPVSAGYNPEELGAALRTAVSQSPAATRRVERSGPVLSGTPPACPRCGTTMVLRTTKRGTKAGETFFGCPGYPRCHGIVTA